MVVRAKATGRSGTIASMNAVETPSLGNKYYSETRTVAFSYVPPGIVLKVPFLRKHLIAWFGFEMATLRNSIFVPLGGKVAEALVFVAKEVGINTNRILVGLPHPSGANAEHIAFFLDRKSR